MGNKPTFPLYTPLGCLLAHWERYQLEGLKKKSLIKYCTRYWPTYSLEGGGKWAQLGSIGLNTILWLSQYCKHKGKYKEVPFVWAFIALYQHSKKETKYKLEEFYKCSFKVLFARSEAEDPLDLLLTFSAQAEGHEERKFRQARKSGG